jgi:hypothetical protein
LEHQLVGGGLGGGGIGGGGRGGGEYSTHLTDDCICAPVTVFFVTSLQHSPVDASGLSGFPWLKPSLAHLQPGIILSLEHTSAGGGDGGGGIGGGGRGGGEYFTHLFDVIICAPVMVFLVASLQHSGDVDGGLSGFPLPKPWLAHLQPATMLSLEHTSPGGWLGGGGIGGGGQGGGECFTHLTDDCICAPVTICFVDSSQHSPVDTSGLSDFPWPKPWFAHLQPATMLTVEHTPLGGGNGGDVNDFGGWGECSWGGCARGLVGVAGGLGAHAPSSSSATSSARLHCVIMYVPPSPPLSPPLSPPSSLKTYVRSSDSAVDCVPNTLRFTSVSMMAPSRMLSLGTARRSSIMV